MFKITQQATDSLDIRIDGDIRGGWEYDPDTDKFVQSRTSSAYITSELAKHPDVKQINLFINSWGGYVKEAYGIMSQLKQTGAHITAYNEGFACSAAAHLLLCSDKVIMPKNAMVMVHNMATEAYGNSIELRKAADTLDKMMEGCKQVYLDRAKNGMTEEQLTEMLNAETWLTAQECLEIGWCDEISDTIDMVAAASAVKQSAQSAPDNPAARAVFNKATAYNELKKSWLDNLKEMRNED